MERFVCYYRVSTARQGESGLGLEAQKSAAEAYVLQQKGVIVSEFTEVESGKNDKRVKLEAAIQAAKTQKAVLLIAKLDRLSRNVEFLFKLKSEVDRGVLSIKALDLSDFNTLTLGILATIAQSERETISARIKAALKAKKQRGEKMGTPSNLDKKAREKGQIAIKEAAKNNQNTQKAALLIQLMSEKGYTLQAIAAELEKTGFKTSRGKAKWTATQVRRVLLSVKTDK